MVLPLGTGNDLARSLGWGAGYSGERLTKILENICHAKTVDLDRWEIHKFCEKTGNLEPLPPSFPVNVINNYLSIGIDARIATAFDEKRQKHPEQFTSRMGNKMVYAVEVVNRAFSKDIKLYKQIIQLKCDGKDYTEKIQNTKMTFMVLANICSYGGGFNLWGKGSVHHMARSGWEPQYCDDQKIEVMVGSRIDFLNHFTLGKHLTRIAQAKEVILVLEDDNYMQIDGEPWFHQSEKANRVKSSLSENSLGEKLQSLEVTANGDASCQQQQKQTPSKTFGLKISYKNSSPMLLGPKDGKMTNKNNKMMKIESSPLARTTTQQTKFRATLDIVDNRKTQSCDHQQTRLDEIDDHDEENSNEETTQTKQLCDFDDAIDHAEECHEGMCSDDQETGGDNSGTRRDTKDTIEERKIKG